MPRPSAGRPPTRARFDFSAACRWLRSWNCSASGCRFCSTGFTAFTSGSAGTAISREYPWTGNWMYTAQRWTGGIAFAYIVWHTYTIRFTGVDLHVHAGASFGKVQAEVFQTPLFLFYVVALIAASWHFAYGIWLFAAKWGLTSGEKARQRFLKVCLGLFLVMSAAGLASLTAFRSRSAAGDRSGRSAGHRGRETRPYGITDHGDPVEEWQLRKSLWWVAGSRVSRP